MVTTHKGPPPSDDDVAASLVSALAGHPRGVARGEVYGLLKGEVRKAQLNRVAHRLKAEGTIEVLDKFVPVTHYRKVQIFRLPKGRKPE